MSVYATAADLEDAIGARLLLRIADRDGDGTADEVVVQQALEDASSEIDAALAKRYSLPLSTVPSRLRALAIDLAHYILDRDPVEDVRKRAEAARRSLRDLATGVTLLTGVGEQGEASAPATGGAQNVPALRDHASRLDMDGFA